MSVPKEAAKNKDKIRHTETAVVTAYPGKINKPILDLGVISLSKNDYRILSTNLVTSITGLTTRK